MDKVLRLLEGTELLFTKHNYSELYRIGSLDLTDEDYRKLERAVFENLARGTLMIDLKNATLTDMGKGDSTIRENDKGTLLYALNLIGFEVNNKCTDPAVFGLIPKGEFTSFVFIDPAIRGTQNKSVLGVICRMAMLQMMDVFRDVKPKKKPATGKTIKEAHEAKWDNFLRRLRDYNIKISELKTNYIENIFFKPIPFFERVKPTNRTRNREKRGEPIKRKKTDQGAPPAKRQKTQSEEDAIAAMITLAS